MLLEKFTMTEFADHGFNPVTATVSRMHQIDLINSQEVGDKREPEATVMHIRVDGTDILLRLERKEDGSWGNYLFDKAQLATPQGQALQGAASKAPDSLVTILKAYFPQSPSTGPQPKPN